MRQVGGGAPVLSPFKMKEKKIVEHPLFLNRSLGDEILQLSLSKNEDNQEEFKESENWKPVFLQGL